MGHPNRHFGDTLKKYILIGVTMNGGIEAGPLVKPIAPPLKFVKSIAPPLKWYEVGSVIDLVVNSLVYNKVTLG